MKRGRPKTKTPKRAYRNRRNADDAMTANEADPDARAERRFSNKGRPVALPDSRAPRRTPKRALLAAVAMAVNDPKAGDILSAADRKLITQASADGITVADVAALVVYKMRLATRLYERGELAGKDLLLALDRGTSQAAAVAQLAAASPSLPPRIEVVLSMDALPKAVPRLELVRPLPGLNGDILDVAG
jgi:hypothetical protein